MREPHPSESRSPSRLPAWAWPLVLVVPLEAWREALAREIPRVMPGVQRHGAFAPGVLVAIGLATVVLGALVEAAFYGMLWGARGLRLPLLATALVLVQVSISEPLALSLMLRVRPGSAHAAWLVPVVGARALWTEGQAPSAFAAAFGGAGGLAAARIAVTAGTQAGLVGRRAGEALAIVAASWLASHLAQWWLLELLQGRTGPR